MGLTANVVANAPILSTWGNEIRDRTVQPFTNAAERSAQWTAPPEGAISYLRDVDRVEFYNGTAWTPFAVAARTWGIIAEVLLASDGPISFPAISGSYSHLQLICKLRAATSGTTDSLLIRVNSDTGANYFDSYVQGAGTAVTAGSGGRTGAFFAGVCEGNQVTPSRFSVHTIDVIDYAGAHHKMGHVRAGAAEGGVGYEHLVSWLWINTVAISQLDFLNSGGPTWKAGSRVTLLAIK